MTSTFNRNANDQYADLPLRVRNPTKMIEDDIYRASTQYKLWSFTPQRLAEIRQETNELASEKLKAAFRRARGVRNDDTGDGEGEDGEGDEDMGSGIETLTVDEELKIVEWGCGKIIEMGEAMRPMVPGGVVVCPLLSLSPAFISTIYTIPPKCRTVPD